MIRISGRARALSLVLATTLAGFGLGAPAAQASPTTAAAHQRPALSPAEATAALSRAEQLFRGSRAQSRAVQRHEDPTIALLELRRAYSSLSAAQRRAADGLLARPSSTASSAEYITYTATVSEDCDSNLCVHFDLASGDPGGHNDPTNGVDPTDVSPANGIPDYVDEVLATVAHVRSTYQTAGYRMPLDDSSSPDNGGDSKTDIYLGELGNQQLYGYCTSDDPAHTYYASAYCVLDNNYSHSEFPANTPLQNLQVTAAHEFFHAVQFSYDAEEDPWIMEATAVWAEDELYTSINDNLQYLRYSPNPITTPGLPLDTNGNVNLHWYGTWIFFRYLTERLVTSETGGLPVLIRQIWQRLDANTAANAAAPDQYSIQGVRSALAAHGFDFATAISKFDLAARHPTTYFGEAAANHYPRAPIAASTSVGPGHLSWSTTFKLLHLSYRVLRLSPTAGTGSAWRLRLHLDLPAKTRGAAATLWINTPSGGPSSRLIPLSSTGDATLNMAFNSTSVKNIEVEVINASTRFAPNACWPSSLASTFYSCYAAHGLDDNLAQYVTATAYRS